MIPLPRLALPAAALALPAAALALLALCACHHSDDDDCGGCPPPPAPAPYDFWEIEPNDSGCCPDVIGTVYIGDEFIIGGTIRDDSLDPFDGFGLTSGEPLEVEFFLEPVAGSADLDLGVWDPAIGDFVLLWDSPGATEGGRFTIPSTFKDFQLVVMSWAGDAEYRLWVWIDPPSLFTLASAPAEPTRLERPVPLALYAPAPEVAPEPLAD